ncbi:hypothetical protein TrRE_jg12209 [Triparma retinervis]|uniref:Coiled-coil domain-containing protein 12 n=1 Tax=Triparma retinervis TaxID=2557542 RepID=A0A9W7G6C2_9STRA|nr:hypothetical protein TrRE_jg12209 [Triparma retinervis]
MADRAARLKALRAKAGRSKGPSESTESKSQGLKLRNYTPSDENLGRGDVDENDESSPASKRQKKEGEMEGGEEVEPKSAIEQALEEAKRAQLEMRGPGDEIAALAPKKINWDLKRDAQGRLDKLEKRTQRAIIGLLKERLEREAEEEGEESEEEEEEDGELD